jgi:putative ABC transport system substrate-binding protein
MRRREFIGGLAGAAVSPGIIFGQQRTVPAIGFLSSESLERWSDRLRDFRAGLADTGYTEGHNVIIEFRWAEGDYSRLPGLAAELVERQVSVIAALGNTSAVLAAKSASSTIPIIFVVGRDPIDAGIVHSLHRPGHNATGVTMFGAELGPKRLELLYELLPAATDFALLVNPANSNAEVQSRAVQAAAHAMGLKLHVLEASTPAAIEAAFQHVVESRASGLVISTDGTLLSHSEQIASLSVRWAVPAIFQYRAFAAAGGVMSYGGSSFSEGYRTAGTYAGRVLNGEKVSDMSVQQVSEIRLFVNLRSAKSIGIAVPQSLLARADEVIE